MHLLFNLLSNDSLRNDWDDNCSNGRAWWYIRHSKQKPRNPTF